MPDGATQTLVLPVPEAKPWPILMVPERMTESAWTQMLAVLNAMKPGIVSDPDPKTDKDDD